MAVELVLFGGGAFAVEVATYIADINEAARALTGHPAFLVTDIVSPGTTREADFEVVLRVRPAIHATVETVAGLSDKSVIICIGDPAARYRLRQELSTYDVTYESIIHPTARISASATLGQGVIACPFVFVGPFARVDDNVALNVGVIVGHDAVVEHSAALSPGSCINGHTQCGVASFLGACATLIPQVRLGHFSKLSAGSVLTKDVGDGFLMHGNPAAGRHMIRVPPEFVH